MKVAILETVKAFAGFELEFDRIIIEELKRQGHEPVLFLPEGTVLDRNFDVPIVYLDGGRIVSYDHVHGLQKIWASFQRERRRVRWFDSAADKAKAEGVELILLTTATYRYLRSLRKSRLKIAGVPVIFIFLGVNPQEKPLFLRQAHACLPWDSVSLCITTLRDDFGEKKPANVHLIAPPVMIPESCRAAAPVSSALRIGFFGHYRKGEKNLAWLLHLVDTCEFRQDVQFVIQAAPTTKDDEADVQQLVEKYTGNPRVTFITKALLGDEWYQAIQKVDVVFLPYTAERYRYNWSAIYFTAIGCGKPVLVTDILNPEVLRQYPIGAVVNMEDEIKFRQQLQQFVESYAASRSDYDLALRKAAQAYSKERFIQQLLENGIQKSGRK